MNKLLCVYNTSGIGGGDGVRAAWYIDCVRSLLNQSLRHSLGPDFQIAVSSCCNHDGVQAAFTTSFGTNISYNFVEDPLPLGVTFNDTVDKCVRAFGPFEGYLYIDSGITFWDPSVRFDAVEKLFELYSGSNCGILAAFPSNDDGSSWWNITYQPGVDHEFALGSSTNMHCQIFSEKWRETYRRILPDVLGSNCSESLFSLQCRAIHQKYKITQKVHVQHLHSLDGASMASRTNNSDFHPLSNTFQTPGHFFRKTDRTIDELYYEGHKWGFGFEAYQPYWQPDPSKFDSEGYAIHPELKEFIRDNFYLKPEEFDYASIKSNFIPAKK